MINERVLYNKMRKAHISTLDVHRILEQLDINMSKRTLQNYLDSDLMTCNDDRVKKVIITMIDNYNKLLINLKKII